MPSLPASYKPSLQTFEGKMVLSANVLYFAGLAAATVVDLAMKQAVFSHYANQLTVISSAVLAFNAYFAKLRTNYKTALSALDAPAALGDGSVIPQ